MRSRSRKVSVTGSLVPDGMVVRVAPNTFRQLRAVSVRRAWEYDPLGSGVVAPSRFRSHTCPISTEATA